MASIPDEHHRRRASGFTNSMSADRDERIRQIDADKAILTHVAITPRELLVKKDARTNCGFCERKFRAFSRKLHCRCCGEIVCKTCYRKREVQVGAHVSDVLPVRLCLDCVDKALTSHTADGNGRSVVSSSGDVETSVCSGGSQLSFADRLVQSFKSVGTTSSTISDSLAQIELSVYDDDTDHESACGYDTDDGETSDDEERGGRACWLSSNSNSSSRSSSRVKKSAVPLSRADSHITNSTASSSGSRTLDYVPEDSNLGDFATEFERAVQDSTYEDAETDDVLKQYNVMTMGRQREYDAICELVSCALSCGVAAVAFMGSSAQWYKSKIGISQSQLPREVAFCSRLGNEATATTVVLDVTRDPRFQYNPLVTGSARIRFYASTPIRDPASQHVLGSVFVMDTEPKRQLPPRAMEVLAYASSAVQRLLELCLKDQRKAKQLRRVRSEPRHGAMVIEELGTGLDVRRGSLSSSSSKPQAEKARVRLLDSEELLQALKNPARPVADETTRRNGDRLRLLNPVTSVAEQMVSPPPPSICDEMLVNIDTTQQLLMALRRSHSSKASQASCGGAGGEVEV